MARESPLQQLQTIRWAHRLAYLVTSQQLICSFQSYCMLSLKCLQEFQTLHFEPVWSYEHPCHTRV